MVLDDLAVLDADELGAPAAQPAVRGGNVTVGARQRLRVRALEREPLRDPAVSDGPVVVEAPDLLPLVAESRAETP